LDIAKQVFQVHGADASGHALFRKKIVRTKVLAFFSSQPRCVVAMEACGGAHYKGCKPEPPKIPSAGDLGSQRGL
jgi:transposase